MTAGELGDTPPAARRTAPSEPAATTATAGTLALTHHAIELLRGETGLQHWSLARRGNRRWWPMTGSANHGWLPTQTDTLRDLAAAGQAPVFAHHARGLHQGIPDDACIAIRLADRRSRARFVLLGTDRPLPAPFPRRARECALWAAEALATALTQDLELARLQRQAHWRALVASTDQVTGLLRAHAWRETLDAEDRLRRSLAGPATIIRIGRESLPDQRTPDARANMRRLLRGLEPTLPEHTPATLDPQLGLLLLIADTDAQAATVFAEKLRHRLGADVEHQGISPHVRYWTAAPDLPLHRLAMAHPAPDIEAESPPEHASPDSAAGVEASDAMPSKDRPSQTPDDGYNAQPRGGLARRFRFRMRP